MLPSPLVATLTLVTLAACARAASPPPAPAPDVAARQALLDCATTAVAQAGFELRRRPTGGPAFMAEGRRLVGPGEPGTAIDVLVVRVREQRDSLVVDASGSSGEIVDRQGRYVERVPPREARAAATEVMTACPAQPRRRAA